MKQGRTPFGDERLDRPVNQSVRLVVTRASQARGGVTSPFLAAILAGSLGLAVWASPVVRAEGGRLSFRGSIVEPTCQPASSHVDSFILPAGDSNDPGRFACASSIGISVDPARVYRMTITELPAGSPDRLLNYYTGYIKADGASRESARLVTQTYE